MPRIRPSELPPPYGTPFQVLQLGEDVVNLWPALWQALGHAVAVSWDEFGDAFPNPLKMLDALVRGLQRVQGVVIDIPIRVRAQTFLKSIKLAGGNQRVVTVTGAAQTAVDALVASAQIGTPFNVQHLGPTFFQWFAAWLYHRIGRAKFLRQLLTLLRIGTEEAFINFMRLRFLSAIFAINLALFQLLLSVVNTVGSLLALRILADGADAYFDRALSQKNPRRRQKVKILRRVGGVKP